MRHLLRPAWHVIGGLVIAVIVSALAVMVPGGARQAEAAPAPAIGGKHQLVMSYPPAQLARWTHQRYGGASCAAASGATVSATSLALSLTTTGKPGSCAVVASPSTFSTASGVIEVRAYLPAASGVIADWPAIWMRGDNWPVNGEIDAVEGLTGHDYASYWFTGPASASTCTDQCGQSIDVHPLSAPAGPGWVTVDMAFGPQAASVYYDGKLFARFSGSYVTGKPMQLVLDITQDDGTNGGPPARAAMRVAYVRVFS